MKQQRILQRNFKISFLICCLGFNPSLWAQKGVVEDPSLVHPSLTSKPVQKVAVLGASTTGSLVEGSVGSIHKGCRHRFHCHSTSPTTGFLGPQEIVKPVSLKDQPGVFPAPLMGAANITFNFCCQDVQASVTPVVVRPDGTVFQGLPMTAHNSPQTLEVSSPAQTGIYTLFVLSHQKEAPGTHVKVDASISTQPQSNKSFEIKSFDLNDKDADLFSAEFVYVPSS